MDSLKQLQPTLSAWLTDFFNSPENLDLESSALFDVRITQLERVFGGASRESWRLHIELANQHRRIDKRLFMLRAQPSALIQTDLAVEATAMQAFADTEVPVPEVLTVEMAGSTGAKLLGGAFMLVEELSGEAKSPFDIEPYSPFERQLGKEFWHILGCIAADRGAAEQFARNFSAPDADACWRLELDKWQQVIREDSLGPEPILEAGLRWLRAHPPPPPRALSVVHGDYRSGNFLHEEASVTAVLDWEMAHLGDPIEDVAWAATPLWSQHAPLRPAALIPLEEGLQIWCRASGIALDVHSPALKWWSVFAAVKGMAIWISAGHEFDSASNQQPVNLFSSWICSDLHLQTLASLLAPDSLHLPPV